MKNTNKIISRRSLLNQAVVLGLGVVGGGGLSLTSCSAAIKSNNIASGDLPLALSSLIHHIGISVHDVLKSGEFYSRVFGGNNVNGEQEPALRYFINLHPGEIAIGKLGTAGGAGATVPLIDHHCVEAYSYDGDAFRASLTEEGITNFASIFIDQDGIPVQIQGALDENIAAGEVVPMPSLYEGEPLIISKGYDHVLFRVSDLEQSEAFYKNVFGIVPEERESNVIWYDDGKVRLGMRLLNSGEEPGIDTYAVKVEAFDRQTVAAGLQALGASVEPKRQNESEEILRFADIDGINAYLTSI